MSFVRRLRDAWRALPAEYRLSGVAALFLLGTTQALHNSADS